MIRNTIRMHRAMELALQMKVWRRTKISIPVSLYEMIYRVLVEYIELVSICAVVVRTVFAFFF